MELEQINEAGQTDMDHPTDGDGASAAAPPTRDDSFEADRDAATQERARLMTSHLH